MISRQNESEINPQKYFPLTIQGCHSWVVKILKTSDVDEYKIKSEWIIQDVLSVSKSELYFLKDRKISEEDAIKIVDLVEKALPGYPVQYLTNKTYFYGREYYIEEGVFIPRQETELLVEYALKSLKNIKHKPVVYDLCSGSGVIPLSIAQNTDCCVYATEISKEALKVAHINLGKHKIIGKVSFFEGNLFEPMKKNNVPRADIIISNPPYISLKKHNEVDKNVKKYEPEKALFGGLTGLEYYREILKKAKKYASALCEILMEIGYDQSSDLKKICMEYGYQNINIYKDYSKNDRILHIKC